VIGMMCTEKRPGYDQPRAMNAPAIDAKKNSTAAAGRLRSLGTPARLSIATIAPMSTGDAWMSNIGGSLTVNTCTTLYAAQYALVRSGVSGCQIATM